MRFFLKLCLIVLVLILIGGAVFYKVLLTTLAHSEEFKRFAEQKVSEYLKAKVYIGEIKPQSFNKIALEKIVIQSPLAKEDSQLIRVDRLSFSYNPLQIWKRRFEIPRAIVLNNPTIVIQENQLPYRYFKAETKEAGLFVMPSLNFQGGQIRYLIPGMGKEILLNNIKGRVSPIADQKMEVDIAAKASGFLEGEVHIYGAIDPEGKSQDLWLELENMDFSQDIPLPFKGIEGKVHWIGQDLLFEGLQGTVHGLEALLTGSFKGRQGQPQAALHLRIGKENPLAKLDLLFDSADQMLDGLIQIAGKEPYLFNGKVVQHEKQFVLDPLTLNQEYQGQGEFDFVTGNYRIAFEKGNKRIAATSNLKGLEFVLDFHLDHARLFDLDIVTQGKMYLHSAAMNWKNREFMLRGQLETEYFILEQQPLEDFQASFDLSPSGVRNIRSSWGEKFQMTGQISFPIEKSQANLVLKISDFDLGLIDQFSSKPLPKELKGILEGKVTFQGDMTRPEVAGIFNVKDGKWGQLHYDRGVIQFRGASPYLTLKDSKIWKGRTIFYLTGGVDLSLDNIFSGIKIETRDHVVIFKGLQLVLHEKDASLELNQSQGGKFERLTPLELKATQSRVSEARGNSNDQHEEKSVTLGPKWKF